MEITNTEEYRLAIAERVKLIMAHTDLTVAGFSEFSGLSASHLYAILRGFKDLTTETAEVIAGAVNMTAAQLLKLDRKIPANFNNVAALKNFRASNKENLVYFESSKVDRKLTSYIQERFYESDLFRDGADVAQIKDACNADGRNYTSKQVSQSVNYLAIAKKLRKEMKPMKKKNGEEGTRQVGVYTIFIPEKRKQPDTDDEADTREQADA